MWSTGVTFMWANNNTVQPIVPCNSHHRASHTDVDLMKTQNLIYAGRGLSAVSCQVDN